MSQAAGLARMVKASADRALAFAKGMQAVRSQWPSSRLTPDDPAFLRTSAGTWTGTFTMPDNSLNSGLAYTPVLLLAPLWFPIAAGQKAQFLGVVDAPFASMEGFAGIRYINGDPAQGIDPATAYNENETAQNWGTFYVIGTCAGVTRFRARVAANRTWTALLPSAPAGAWRFELVTYNTAADDAADVNRRGIGNPWYETDHSGDIRAFWNHHYTPPPAPIIVNVASTPSDTRTLISGDIDRSQYTARPGFHYRVILTEEVDVEYVQIMFDVVGNHFQALTDLTFTGGLKLRLIEVSDTAHAPVGQIGPVWDQRNAGDPGAYPDMRMEYYPIDMTIPGFATGFQPAKRDHSWALAHTQNTIGRVRLVDINTQRIFGEHTMPSGLARSYNVPAAQAGQSPDSIYYDGFLDTCFLYDQAVMLIGLIQQSEWTAAQLLIDALLLVQNADGSFPFAASQFILTSDNYSLLRTGAIAWVIYALLIADRPEYRARWHARTNAAALAGLDHIIGNYRNSIGLFKGGKDQNGLTPWWSTEHNIDMWWCLDLADILYGSAADNWRGHADGIKSSLLTYGWDAADGIFWQGGGHTDDTVPDGMHALDMMTWGAAILEKWGHAADRDHAIARAYAKYYVTDDNFHLSGFCTFIPEDGYPPGTVESPWCEGTFGMVLALRDSNPKRAYGLIATMARGQLPDGSYRYTLQRDPIEPIETFPCLIGAAWNVVALSGPETPNPRVIWT
jgi:hypothetical protein